MKFIIFTFFIAIASSSTSPEPNLTEILNGIWNITLYVIDQVNGKEFYQSRVYYSLELKNSDKSEDLYGFLYTYYGKYKDESDISIKLRKKEFLKNVYSIFISTSDVSAFREIAVLNISSSFDGIMAGSGKTYLNDQFSFMISFPNYAEVITYEQNTKQPNLYRFVKISYKDNKLNRWRMAPIIIMALISVFKSMSQNDEQKRIFTNIDENR